MNTLLSRPRKNKDTKDMKLLLLIDTILSMRKQEQTNYAFRHYLRTTSSSTITEHTRELYEWREKICHWTYNVIDHFDLQRETVAISIDLFDRVIAVRGNKCDGDMALLVSLTTLYIAIKLHEKKKIKLCTLTQLSRGQFGPRDIEQMEMDILRDLTWFVHPPTVLEFIEYLLKFLPQEVNMTTRYDVFEYSRYLAELSVCDPFFIEHDASNIAFAAILNVLECDIGYDCISHKSRERFFRDLDTHLHFQRGKPSVRLARDRLQIMLNASSVGGTNNENESPIAYKKRDENTRSSADSVDSRSSKGVASRFRSDSMDSSVGSKGSRSSKGSKGSMGRFFKTQRNRSGSSITPY